MRIDNVAPAYAPLARAERLIAAARFVLAFSSFIAIYLEPSTPPRHQQATYALLLAYTIYALVVLVITLRSPMKSRGSQLISHGTDLILFSTFVYFSEGPASPFFLYFVFSLFCATLRFSWRGILATGLAAMATYGALAAVLAHAEDLEVSRIIVREAYLAVISALLVYLGIFQQRLRSELAALAAWPRDVTMKLDEVLRVTLAHASDVLRTKRVVLLWEETEEPWIHFATLADGGFRLERLAPEVDEALLREDLQNKSVLVTRTGDATLEYDPIVSRVAPAAGAAVGATARKFATADMNIVVSIASDTLAMYLIVPDVRGATSDELALAHVCGRLVMANLEQFFFVQQVGQTASAEERLRLSRDLHDGVVQSLGGVGLQLQALRQRMREDAVAADRLRRVQAIIEHDQRELRAIARELRPDNPTADPLNLRDELRLIKERFALEWALTVEIELPIGIDVPSRLTHEICRIVSESLANAVRHGGASRAEVVLCVPPNREFIDVCIDDNGRGFNFSGRYEFEALEREGIGPRSLRERVKTLGGTLAVESSSGGACVAARLPIIAEAS